MSSSALVSKPFRIYNECGSKRKLIFPMCGIPVMLSNVQTVESLEPSLGDSADLPSFQQGGAVFADIQPRLLSDETAECK